MNHTARNYILLFILIFLATVGIAYFFIPFGGTRGAAAPRPFADPTLNWETYKNNSLQYEIKHPKDWEIQEIDPSAVVFISPSSNLTDPSEEVSIEVVDTISPHDMVLSTMTKDIGPITFKCSGSDDVNIKLSCWTKLDSQEKFLSIKIYTNDDIKVNETYSQIVQSFKFTNQ